jgi:hypothetical protein
VAGEVGLELAAAAVGQDLEPRRVQQRGRVGGVQVGKAPAGEVDRRARDEQGGIGIFGQCQRRRVGRFLEDQQTGVPMREGGAEVRIDDRSRNPAEVRFRDVLAAGDAGCDVVDTRRVEDFGFGILDAVAGGEDDPRGDDRARARVGPGVDFAPFDVGTPGIFGDARDPSVEDGDVGRRFAGRLRDRRARAGERGDEGRQKGEPEGSVRACDSVAAAPEDQRPPCSTK